MSLIDLINEHQTNLNLPNDTRSSIVAQRYRGFVQALLNLSTFQYSRQEMVDTVSHMWELGFSVQATHGVARYAMRRSALEGVTDSQSRQEVWKLLEFAMPSYEKSKMRQGVKNYVERAGKEQLNQTLTIALRGFGRIERELNKMKESIKESPIGDQQRLKILGIEGVHNQYYLTEKEAVYTLFRLVGSL